MSRHPLRLLAGLLALVLGLSLTACGRDDHKNMDHGNQSGAPR